VDVTDVAFEVGKNNPGSDPVTDCAASVEEKAGSVLDLIKLSPYCGPASYIVKVFPLASIRIMDSCSNRYTSVFGVSGLVYGSNNRASILYTCRMLTYESQRNVAPSASSRVGNRFLVFLERASG
jgi:hypothetical protein